jgi:outer membrane protein X
LNAGLKIGSLYGVHDVVKNQSELTGTLTASIINSYLITSDYYFNNTESILAPFVGGGFGLFNVSNLKLALTDTPTYSNLVNFDRDTKIGGLIRCGVEISKIRLGFEYYLIPKSNLYDITYTKVGVTKNSYLTISLGFYFGGGKWKNKN